MYHNKSMKIDKGPLLQNNSTNYAILTHRIQVWCIYLLILHNFTTNFNQILGKYTTDGSYGARTRPRFLTGHAGAMIVSHQPGNPHLTSIFGGSLQSDTTSMLLIPTKVGKSQRWGLSPKEGVLQLPSPNHHRQIVCGNSWIFHPISPTEISPYRRFPQCHLLLGWASLHHRKLTWMALENQHFK